MKMWVILLLFILYLDNCICVPSPQSIKKSSSIVCKTCAVGFLSKAGMAELFPIIVSASNFFICSLLMGYRKLESFLTISHQVFFYYPSFSNSLSISSICKISHASLSEGVTFINSSSSFFSNNCSTFF